MGKVGFEDDHVSVRSFTKLEEKLPEGVEAVAAGGAVEGLRRVKDADELAAIAEASKLADAALVATVEEGFVGKTERAVADAFEARIRAAGGELSFDTIVAAGPNGAQPHAEPGPRVIERGELIVFDMGAKLDGYCSDGTRTYATGDPGEEGRRVYETVLAAQQAALEAIRPGEKGEDVDLAARKVIDDAGHGEHFGHGLGHGVGLDIHEGPRLSLRSDDVLATNEVVTVEPGIYLAGDLGVRIEDLVVVTDDGLRNLSTLPKDLTFVD
jgi:Xaa-Pro aminopeptidase